MNRLGTVTHVSGSKKLILRTKTKVRTGTQVLDEDLRSIGKIVDIFGPVKNPYVSVEPVVNALKNYVGRPLYIL
ncbi:MAG: Gar1/Naf1 family protein [Candidatus Bathyarchaeota archaeon]